MRGVRLALVAETVKGILKLTRDYHVPWSQLWSVCTECGALVPSEFSKVHDAWHSDMADALAQSPPGKSDG